MNELTIEDLQYLEALVTGEHGPAIKTSIGRRVLGDKLRSMRKRLGQSLDAHPLAGRWIAGRMVRP